MAELWGVLAEFDGPERLINAVRSLRQQRFTVETFTPFPLEGLDEALGFSGWRVPIAFLIGGIAGAVIGFGMQTWLNFLFPLWIGGRPLIAIPGFMMITFELTVLGSVLTGVLTMLLSNRLPKLHHPVFDAERFTMAEERFYLALLRRPGFDRDAAGKALAEFNPASITDLAEQPE